MGHYVLGHLWKGLTLAFALILSGFLLVDRSMRWACGPAAARTGFSQPGEPATVPFMILVLMAYVFVTTPLQSAWSRHLESEADQFGMRATPAPAAGPGTFRKMAARNLSDPEPPAFVEWFLYSHPAIGKRIRAAEAYAATLSPPAPSSP
jgi:STE24 endopeptidase